ncbi:MAG TPA: hypothetical protein VIY49_10780 [Bryobacteraceae bacterium]
MFDLFCAGAKCEANSERGVAWVVQREHGRLDFIMATDSGLCRMETFAELMAALHSIGGPTAFPFAEWPGVSVAAIA